jgi:signal transduction histidine kinase/WD40 repeat protein
LPGARSTLDAQVVRAAARGVASRRRGEQIPTMPPTPQPDAPPATRADLRRRRHAIQRGLRFAGLSALAALLLVFALAGGAVWLAGSARRSAVGEAAARAQAEQVARESQTRLWQWQLGEARSHRQSGAPGQRLKALDHIRQAAALQPSLELRNEAIAALLLPDLGEPLWFRPANHGIWPLALTGNFDHYAPYSPTGRVVVVSATNHVQVAELASGTGDTQWLEFSPDDRFLAARFGGGMLQVWDWRAGQLCLEHDSPGYFSGGTVPSIAFSADSRELWSVAGGEGVRRWSLPAGTPLRVNLPAGVEGDALALHPTRPLLATARGDACVIWDRATGARVDGVANVGKINSLAWHPSEARLAVGCEVQGPWIKDVGTNSPLQMTHENVTTMRVQFSLDGDLLIAGNWGGTTFWDYRVKQRVLTTTAGVAWQFNRDHSQLAYVNESQGSGAWLVHWPVGWRRLISPPEFGAGVNGLQFSPDGRWLLVGRGGGLLVWDVAAARIVSRRPREGLMVGGFLVASNAFVTGSPSGPLLWRLEDAGPNAAPQLGEPSRVLPFELRGFDRVALSPDQRLLAVGGQSGLALLRVGDPLSFMPLAGSDRRVHYLGFSPDGRWLVTGYRGHQNEIYDMANRRHHLTLTNSGGHFSFLPDGARLFTFSAARHCLWRIGDWERLPVPPGLVATELASSAGGRLLLRDGPEGALDLRDPITATPVANLRAFEPTVASVVAHDAAGRWHATQNSTEAVHLWDWAALRARLSELSLDWPDDSPADGFLPAQPGWAAASMPSAAVSPAPARRWVWLILGGTVLAIGFGAAMLNYQRRLFLAYGELDHAAEQRAAALQVAQTALGHSEKMKALGTLAAGVAHDFNNLLSVIRLSSELIEEQTQPGGATQENFAAIQQAVQRGRGIVNSMLGYARDDGQVRAFAPGALISDAVALLSKPFLSGIVLHIEVSPDLPELQGRKGRLEQMLLNLVVNAAEAMGGKGSLRLVAREVRDPNGCVLAPRAATRYVELSVTDSGPGIAPEVLPRIFEPFFTTKTKGAQHGTGLGLSMLYTMAQEDGIGVAVRSPSGRGTTFRLLLPVAPGPSELAGRDKPVAPPPEPLHP